jgi:large subunit ribosomal protein L21
MFAVISDRGRQATVHVGDVVLCDYQSSWNPGDTVTFDQVLLMGDEGEVSVGKPNVAGASVTAEVVEHCKGLKEVVFRFKRRKNVRSKRGHRQNLTRVRITGIASEGTSEG